MKFFWKEGQLLGIQLHLVRFKKKKTLLIRHSSDGSLDHSCPDFKGSKFLKWTLGILPYPLKFNNLPYQYIRWCEVWNRVKHRRYDGIRKVLFFIIHVQSWSPIGSLPVDWYSYNLCMFFFSKFHWRYIRCNYCYYTRQGWQFIHLDP